MLQDLRYAMRTLGKQPVFTIAAVACLAVGIGANSALFSVVNAVILQPLPYTDSEELVGVWKANPVQGEFRLSVSPPDFRDWRERNNTLTDMAATYKQNFTLTGSQSPERIQVTIVSPNFFPLLGVMPILGRQFLAEEEEHGRHRVVALSHGFWQRRFGADRNIVGRALIMNGDKYQVVAVMPSWLESDADLWMPMAFAAGDNMNTRLNHYLTVIARRKPEATIEQVTADLDRIAWSINSEQPWAAVGASAASFHAELVRDSKRALIVLSAAVALVLLISCANVANLLLARAAARRKELAVRMSLGANRTRVARQLLTESLVLGLLGGALGLLLAYCGVAILVNSGPEAIPRLHEVRIDVSVLLFTVLISVMTSVAFGLLPAMRTAQSTLSDALKQGGSRTTTDEIGKRTRPVLVAVEVALAALLLISAGLMVRSFQTLQTVDTGFEKENVITVFLPLRGERYRDSRNRIGFYQDVIDRVRSLPGVTAAGANSHLPLTGRLWGKLFSVEGQSGPTTRAEVARVRYQVVDGEYFQAMGIPIRQGRPFIEADDESQPVAIISANLSRRFFGDQDPIGKRFRMGPPPHLMEPQEDERPWLTVLGVAADVKHESPEREFDQGDDSDNYVVYALQSQAQSEASGGMHLVVRASSGAETLSMAIREQVWEIDPDVPVTDVATMGNRFAQAVAGRRFTTALFALFGVTALGLASLGVYGVLSYSVAQRTQEFGIRIAIGAQSLDIIGQVIRQGMLPVACGLGIGLVGSLLLARVMESLVYGVSVYDPLAISGALAVLLLIAFVAMYAPARRATRIDPMVALRYE